MRRIDINKKLAKIHVNAVVKRIEQTYNKDKILAKIHKIGMNSIQDFLMADIKTMHNWVSNCSDDLQITEFKRIYSQYFSNGVSNYVYDDYNAYKFLELIDIAVCPYCDDEHLDIVTIEDKEKRTSEIDHFYPKTKYPALAMCFYNLVPSGQICNSIKLEQIIGANPYDERIEKKTFLYPDIPLGVSMESVSPADCKIQFHPQGEMKSNVELLGLEERYKSYAPEAHRLLLNLQRYNDEKIQELIRMGLGTREDIISTVFGPQDPEEKKHTLRQKMLKDLTGY